MTKKKKQKDLNSYIQFSMTDVVFITPESQG